MKKQLFVRLGVVLLLLAVLATPAIAGGIGFNGPIAFSIGSTTTTSLATLATTSASTTTGSLIAQGTLTGLGTTDVDVTLIGTALPVVGCTNQGGNWAPGQNPPHLSSSGTQALNYLLYQKNGTTTFDVGTLPPTGAGLTATQLGCPNDNWTATILSLTWTGATVNVTNPATGDLLATRSYTCVQPTATTISCTLVK